MIPEEPMNKQILVFTFLISAISILPRIPSVTFAETEVCKSVGIESRPSGSKDRFRHAYCHYEKGYYYRALKHLEGLEKSLPVLEDYILYFRASSLAESGKTNEAIVLLNRLLGKYSTSSLYKSAVEKLADINYKQGNYETAIGNYNKLMAIEESDWLKSRYIERIATIYEKSGNISQAMELYKEIWSKYPQTNYADRIHSFSNKYGMEFTPTSQERMRRAEVLFNTGRRNEALKEYMKLPSTNHVNTKIAICLYYIDRQQQALDILNNINKPEADFWRGKILEKNGKTEAAIRSYYSSFLFFPANEYAQRGLMTAAELDKSLGRYDHALEKYRSIVKKSPDSQYNLDATWNTGWIMYLKGDYKNALDVFTKHSYPGNSLNADRFLYWKAKTLEKLGEKDQAYKIYNTIAHSGKYSYHAFLSRLKIGHKPREKPVKEAPDSFSGKTEKQKLEILMGLGLNQFVRQEAEQLRDDVSTSGESVYLGSVYYRLGDYYSTVGITESFQDASTLFYSFPKAYKNHVEKFSKKYSLEDLLVYSLIREESRFDRKAVSSSDARGLMQLLPATAVEAAQQSGVTPFRLDMLYEPEVNIDIGSFYLRKMLDRFKGDIPLALAGYNAGPNRIAALLEIIEYDGFDEFVEMVPIFETKDYVKKILRSYGSYQALYGYK